MDQIRVWKEFDIQQIEKQIVVLDDIQGFCPGCKKAGIPYESLLKCPSCGRTFAFASLRERGDVSGILAKVQKKAPHLTVVDHTDYEHALSRKKSMSLFKITSDDDE